MFLVIEGIDGSGKGTQFEKLRERLVSEGKSVYTLDFPRYEEPSSFFVQKYLNGGYGEDVSAKASSLFYALDRFDALRGKAEELAEYDVIISNRYVSASMIHQGGKIESADDRSEYLRWLDDLEYEILGLPRPDLTIFLDVHPDVARSLVAKKDDREYITGDENIDLHEKDETHLDRAYAVCQEICEMRDDWASISCVDQGGSIKTIDEIHELVYDLYDKSHERNPS